MKKILISTALLFTPVAAFAQFNGNFGHLNNLIGEVMAIASQAVNLLMIGATLYFLWVVISLIRSNDKDRAEKKQQLKWAIIGLAAMVTVWGLIKFAANTLGISTTGLDRAAVPCPPGMVYDSQIGCH